MMRTNLPPSPMHMTQPVRRPLDLKATLIMVTLCLIWGVQQTVMKGVADDIPPLLQLAIRFVFATLFFAVLVFRREGIRACLDGTLWSGAVLGGLFAGEFLAIGQALMHTTSAHTTVFLYSAPVFTALGVQMFPEERLTGGQWVGVALAVGGIGVAFLGYSDQPVREMIVGDLYALAGGVCWGASNVWLRHSRIGNAHSNKTVLYQVAVAAVVTGLSALHAGQTTAHWTLGSVAIMAYQTITIGMVSYMTWFWLLRHYLTSRLMLISLLTPLCAVIAGHVFLDEVIDPRFALGTALVLVGILAVNARQIFQRS